MVTYPAFMTLLTPIIHFYFLVSFPDDYCGLIFLPCALRSAAGLLPSVPEQTLYMCGCLRACLCLLCKCVIRMDVRTCTTYRPVCTDTHTFDVCECGSGCLRVVKLAETARAAHRFS